MVPEGDYKIINENIHRLAAFYTGTSLLEFKEMPLAELDDAIEIMNCMNKEREVAVKR